MSVVRFVLNCFWDTIASTGWCTVLVENSLYKIAKEGSKGQNLGFSIIENLILNVSWSLVLLSGLFDAIILSWYNKQQSVTQYSHWQPCQQVGVVCSKTWADNSPLWFFMPRLLLPCFERVYLWKQPQNTQFLQFKIQSVCIFKLLLGSDDNYLVFFYWLL